jgi:hypothetical protein
LMFSSPTLDAYLFRCFLLQGHWNFCPGNVAVQ